MDALALMLLLVIAVAFAAHLFSLSWPDPRWRWNSLAHDRNGHYEYGLNMGLALREGNLPQFFAHLEKGKVWPPVHGLLVAALVGLAGPDHRLAALPSLTGWLLTIVFGYLAARMLFSRPGAGILAGALAATCIAASPAHRMFATDVMLEALGAGLSMLTLTLYLRVVQAPDLRWQWSALAVALTVLFFEKYNYWVLVVLALVGDQLISQWPRNRGWVRSARGWPWSSWLTRQWREPLNYLFVGLVVVVIGVQLHGPTFVELVGHRVSIYPPKNLTTAAYAVLLVRVVRELILHRQVVMAWLGAPGRRLLWGLGAPIAVSLLLPGRLSTFLWYTGPLHHGEQASRTLGNSLAFYVQALIQEYHPASWCLVLVVALALAAVILRSHLRPGWLAVALLAGVSMVLVVVHPNQKTRFLHSWLPALWVLAGAGAGTLLYHARLDRLGRLRPWLAATLVIAVIVAIGPAWRGPGHAADSGAPSSLSTLDISDAYLPHLDGTRSTAVFIAAFAEPFVNWTYREHHRCSRGLVDTSWWMRLTPVGDVPQQLPAWLAAKHPDAVVGIVFSPQSPHYSPGPEQQVAGMVAAIMPEQSDYTLTQRYELDRHGCTVTLWQHR